MAYFNSFVNAKKSLNVRFIGRHILFGAFMAKDSWHGVIWQNFLPTIRGHKTNLSIQPVWPTLFYYYNVFFLLMQKSH